MKYCARCGREFEGESIFCPECTAAAQHASPHQQAPQYQQASQYQPPTEVDAPNTGFTVLAVFFPIVGLILWLIWKDKTPLKAKSCLKGAIIGIVVSAVLTILFSILGVILGFIGAASSSMYYYY